MAVFEIITRFLLRFRIATLLIVAAGGGFLLYKSSSLRAEFRVQALFSQQDAERRYFDEVRKTYGADDDLVFVVVQSPDVFDAKTIALLRRLTRSARALPSIRRVESLVTISDLGGSGQGNIDTTPIYGLKQGPIPPDGKKRALASPLVRTRLVNQSGTLTLLAINLIAAAQSPARMVTAVSEIEDIVKSAKLPPRTHLRLAGVPVIRTAVIRQIKVDQRIFIPLGGVITMLILLWLYRSPKQILSPMIAIGLSVAATLGIMVLVDLPMDILSNVLPVLVLVYGVADAVHLRGRVDEQIFVAQKAGPLSQSQRNNAIALAMRHVGLACLITSITTGVGFGSLLTSDLSLLKRFGALSAMGVMIAYVATMVVIPLGASFGRTKVGATSYERYPAFSRMLAKLGLAVAKKPWRVVALALAISGAALAFGSTISVNNYLLGAFTDQHQVSITTKLLERELQGSVSLQVNLRGKKDAIKDPKNLRAMAKLQRWLARHDSVTGSLSAADYVKEMHRAVVGTAKLPETPEGVAQLLLLTEGNSGIDQFVDYGYSQGRIVVNMTDIGAQRYLKLVDQLRHEIEHIFVGTTVEARPTGTSLLAYRGVNRLVNNLMVSLGIALLVIGVILALTFRSLLVGAVSLLPNLVPLAIGLGFMAVADLYLDPTNVMIFTIALGIAVDDTIHFIARYREEALGGRAPADAISRTLETSGRAMVITSLILTLGFSTLFFSEFNSTQRFGVVGVVVFSAALATDLLLTPALLAILRPWARNPSADNPS